MHNHYLVITHSLCRRAVGSYRKDLPEIRNKHSRETIQDVKKSSSPCQGQMYNWPDRRVRVQDFVPQLQQYIHWRNRPELWKKTRGAQKRSGIHQQQNIDTGRSEGFGSRNQQVSHNRPCGKGESYHRLVWCQDP